MAMTKADYHNVATVIRNVPLESLQRATMAVNMASELSKHDDRFDKENFIMSCGFSEMIGKHTREGALCDQQSGRVVYVVPVM